MRNQKILQSVVALSSYSKSKLELNSKKVELEWCIKIFVCVLSFFSALKSHILRT